MTKYLVSACLILALTSAMAQAKDQKPGVERWAIKTTVAKTVPSPTPIDFDKFIGLSDPPSAAHNNPNFQKTRYQGEDQIVSVRGYVFLVAGESDGDYHIQISNNPTSGDQCIVVEVPKDDPIYVPDQSVREQAGVVRQLIREKLLHGREPSSTGSVIQHPPYMEFTGGLFFDDAHVGDPPRGKKGMHAATLWEIHPVIAARFIKP
ncbi:hypothetical protein GALL_144300 [mine drainage metagenome]|uniref:Uncharacterized protein n=1 Tax=mine drainage metagenome TaxID=410659 RepID=A0A1J5S6M1_9ZZZZ